ncbi:hypothetical protein [Syntrophaceticus schinkii]|uniref:hypothetical protein n=1 Tax=Syntrophaceticus schinkii TaxID=499207 RepID=UPI0005CBC3F0|nr:hypothetical protein [Syntrophaceticus schinkii]
MVKQQVCSLPSSGKKSKTAWEVQEEVMRKQTKGQSLTQVAGELTAAGGPYSEKSLWRWTTRWNRLLRDSGNIFWTQILRVLPHIQLPVGKMKPRTEWGWLFKIWDQVRQSLEMISCLTGSTDSKNQWHWHQDKKAPHKLSHGLTAPLRRE